MSKGTPMLTVRCPPDLRKAARETAEANGTNLTEVVLGFLQRYVEHGVNTPEPSVRTPARRARPGRGTVQGTDGPLRSARQDCPPEGFTPQKPDSQRCVCGLTIKHHLGGTR